MGNHESTLRQTRLWGVLGRFNNGGTLNEQEKEYGDYFLPKSYAKGLWSAQFWDLY